MKILATLSTISLCLSIGLLTTTCTSPEHVNDKEDGIAVFDPSIPDTIRIAGAYALYPIVAEWAGLFEDKYPNIVVEVKRTSMAEAKQLTSNGLIDMAMISQELQIRTDCWRVAVAKSGVIPLINSNNPYLKDILSRGVTHSQLVLGYRSGEANWGDWLGNGGKDPIVLIKRADTSGAGITWSHFLWMDESEVQARPVYNEEEMLQAVIDNVYALGYANMNNAFDIQTRRLREGLTALPMDLNYNGRIDFIEQISGEIDEFRRAVCLGKYPKNLCRNLYFASPTEPASPVVKAFVEFCLTEGQPLIDSLGYGSIKGN